MAARITHLHLDDVYPSESTQVINLCTSLQSLQLSGYDTFEDWQRPCLAHAIVARPSLQHLILNLRLDINKFAPAPDFHMTLSPLWSEADWSTLSVKTLTLMTDYVGWAELRVMTALSSQLEHLVLHLPHGPDIIAPVWGEPVAFPRLRDLKITGDSAVVLSAFNWIQPTPLLHKLHLAPREGTFEADKLVEIADPAGPFLLRLFPNASTLTSVHIAGVSARNAPALASPPWFKDLPFFEPTRPRRLNLKSKQPAIPTSERQRVTDSCSILDETFRSAGERVAALRQLGDCEGVKELLELTAQLRSRMMVEFD